jgi:hypothetical protein
VRTWHQSISAEALDSTAYPLLGWLTLAAEHITRRAVGDDGADRRCLVWRGVTMSADPVRDLPAVVQLTCVELPKADGMERALDAIEELVETWAGRPGAAYLIPVAGRSAAEVLVWARPHRWALRLGSLVDLKGDRA